MEIKGVKILKIIMEMLGMSEFNITIVLIISRRTLVTLVVS